MGVVTAESAGVKATGLTAENRFCRVCASKDLVSILNLGPLPLANGFVSKEELSRPDPLFPLELFYCRNCHLVQLVDVVDKRAMFDEYPFMTSASKSSIEHFDRYAEELIRRLRLDDSSFVVDIGSNDGTLLKSFAKAHVKVLGLEPARNVAQIAIASGIDTLVDYFTEKTVSEVESRYGRPQLITANNVVSHVSNLHEFLANIGKLLSPKGVFTFEVPWVVDVLRHNSFDLVYHEHLSYFGFKPLSRLLDKYNMEIFELEYFPEIHGGSYRAYVSHKTDYPLNHSKLKHVFDNEDSGASLARAKGFGRRIGSLREKLRKTLFSLKSTGVTMAGYGAPAKATILLNYCGIDRSVLDFISDTTLFKQGKFLPGVRIPIVAPDMFHKAHPDYALLLAWNFEKEILEKEKDYITSGGKFIVPLPEPRVIG